MTRVPEENTSSKKRKQPDDDVSDRSKKLLGRRHALGPALAPALREVTEDRISDIRWFLTDWQRGGAATAYAKLLDKHGKTHEVVIKVPVRLSEIRWLTRMDGLGDEHNVGPIIFEHGLELGGYDFAWIIMERFAPGPLAAHLDEQAWQQFADVAARFYARAQHYPVDQCPRRENWHALLERARERAQINITDNAQEWNKAIKTVQKSIDSILAVWQARNCDTWCHGDLHPANAMRRDECPDRAYLIDMAEVHAGHWIEDAVYAERLFWGHPERMLGTSVVERIAESRKKIGLDNGKGYHRLADIRRVLMAATAPAFLSTEGNPAHLHGTLEILQKTIPAVIR